MKKIAMMVTGLVLALSLCACGCANNAPATTPSENTTNTTGATQKPMATDSMTIPVPETNIPDPSVDGTDPSGMESGTVGRSVH